MNSFVRCRCGWRHEEQGHNRTALEVKGQEHENKHWRQPHRHNTNIVEA